MANTRRTSSSSGRRRTASSTGRPAPGTAADGGAPNGGAGADGPLGSADPGIRRRDYSGWRSLLNPLWCYHGFRVAVLALTCFGVVMVFSSSAVDMVAAGESPWSQAVSQGIYCVLGLAVAFVAMHVPVPMYRRFGAVVVGIAMLLQLLTLTPLGVTVSGNTGWISVAGVFTIQPAEVMKLALCIWLPTALIIARRRFPAEGIKAYAAPLIVYVACLGLVMLGRDMGTGMILVMIGVVAFLVGGFPGKWMAIAIGVVVVAAAAFVISSPNRLNRVLAAYQSCEDTQGVCYQSTHARYAIASGGLFGVGIGNSREKWNYLPAAHNDFIFAIIGEETGFIGAALVILLFVVVGWCMVVMALQSRDRYVAMVLMCIAVWLVGQGLVNIAVVVGLLPVMGVPMPFVSAGGSSLIMCLAAAGTASSMMRSQPQVRAESVRA
ncbi:peptidoglycan glycosyltransferase FtsW [Bifidobacterium phasiani]|uniref:Probable peptidoglycan glycosyltransferase FtsW n=1 Tax=Bifidobacterium phasiani TaxID=2834431 RepID=A0ABS6WC20_9BIFI|nr:putative peptidoglycan glycosyltransferase FtsW [Bifidobacterium phasiani]MBW3083609.1 cell division protein FtsW [Bifidobacterium phasiani]